MSATGGTGETGIMAIGIIAIIGTIVVAVGIGAETVVAAPAAIAGAVAVAVRIAGRVLEIAGPEEQVQVVIGGPGELVEAGGRSASMSSGATE